MRLIRTKEEKIARYWHLTSRITWEYAECEIIKMLERRWGK
jgi:hypothetical protein